LECSNDFHRLNFEPKTNKVLRGPGEEMAEFLLTRDGCAYLTMGFTGAKAAAFKEAYIAVLN